ncbi:DEAD/DEAH box helicase [Tenuibacillus multivorans]|uniref:Helicase conserved C-terminal domain-containing protein n=1 Tax=Tenuibacillus multivorans TaxID=237069 RepID=A0A1G9Z8W3_9BACI|nr:SNF2-related protein [Tenuibacillus multivorans]GEL77348.1 helicase [Tenuibacillus multivorans]SDN17809.1 Helicase conserved C-terminal domain-containing protein [Tenuibacillus multivorans]
MKLVIDDHDLDLLSNNLDHYQSSDWDTFKQAYTLSQMKMNHKDALTCMQYLPHLELMSHQLDAVKKVLHQMHGRAILADEVGLGKTVEAGVILKELMVKGLVKKVLILVPSSLIRQWESELNKMFYIPAKAKHRSYPWQAYDIVISSIDLAKKDPHSSDILNEEYDMLIVDEAHRLKNPKTRNYQFVKQIRSTYCLLLTATPIQNKIDEIYYLMSIVRPGLLGDKQSFKRTVREERKDDNSNAIQTLVKQSMVRNRRSETTNHWTKRDIDTIYVDFTDEEMEFYKHLESLDGMHSFTALTLQREICSSREACYQSIGQSNWNDEFKKDLMQQIEQLPHHAKALKTVEFVKSLNEKCIIFTEYKSTQIYLQWLLHQNGILSVTYNGGFRKSKKEWMIQLFKNNAQVLIATDAGGEGLNLQFCNHMIHYDLPWNPMKLEQRIGRIHRFGQTKDVNIYYTVLRNTIDQRILDLLYDKLDLFKDVIGELDQILSQLGIQNLEDEIEEIVRDSRSEKEASIKVDHLFSVISDSHVEERNIANESS